jgi:hypothetical protein
LQSQTSQLQQNDPLYQQLLKGNQSAVSNLYAAPAEARAQNANIFNPVAREALVSRAIGNALGALTNSNNLIKQEGGYASQKAQTALDLLKQKISSAEAGVTASGKNRTDLLSQLDKAFTMQKSGQQQDFTNRLALARLSNSQAGKEPKYTIKQTQPNDTPFFDATTNSIQPKTQGGTQYLRDGVPVSPAEYAVGVNKNLAEVLASSPSKSDQGYAQELAGILKSGDAKKAQDFRSSHSWLFGDIVPK